MRLRRFRSSNVKDALSKARTELGPEALVLSTRVVPLGGWRGWLGEREVEVTAAVERDLPVGKRRGGDVGLPPVVSGSHARRASIVEAAQAGRDALIARLCATGLDRSIADAVARSVPRTGRRSSNDVVLQQALADAIAEATSGAEEPARVEVFVGPPGAGKTSTVAKLAAQARARRGERLTLVSTDACRLGALEQLRMYADVVGATFHVARTPGELMRTLDGARTRVVVDTAGAPPTEPDAVEMCHILSHVTSVRTHLVVSAASPARLIERVLENYRIARPTRLVLTKVDEAESVAPLIGWLKLRALPISFLGTGQRVPEDLQSATPSTVAAHILGTRSRTEWHS